MRVGAVRLQECLAEQLRPRPTGCAPCARTPTASPASPTVWSLTSGTSVNQRKNDSTGSVLVCGLPPFWPGAGAQARVWGTAVGQRVRMCRTRSAHFLAACLVFPGRWRLLTITHSHLPSRPPAHPPTWLGLLLHHLDRHILAGLPAHPRGCSRGTGGRRGRNDIGLQLRERRHTACLLYTIAAPYSLSILLSIMSRSLTHASSSTRRVHPAVQPAVHPAIHS
jgi:hypothetical protein